MIRTLTNASMSQEQKIDRQDFAEGIKRVCFPKRPDRREWSQPIIDYLEKRGIQPVREEIVEAWECFSASRCAGWLDANEDTLKEFVNYILGKENEDEITE
jgi:hypothetical protein